MKHNWENYFDISSEYWKKVEKIYEDSESFPKKVVKDRNLHHKFPRSFSKKDGEDVDNDEDNLVSLSLADHFRVHYYLWKCTKKGYRGMMAKAFVFMRKKMVVYASDETIEQLAKDYEEAMKEAAEQHSKAMEGKYAGEKHPMYGKHHTEESKKKNREAHTGKHTSEETRRKMREARKRKYVGENSPFYGKKHSEETKKKMSEASKGNKYRLGKKLSEETRNKLSLQRTGRHWFNNGKESKFCFECPPGFTPGRIK